MTIFSCKLLSTCSNRTTTTYDFVTDTEFIVGIGHIDIIHEKHKKYEVSLGDSSFETHPCFNEIYAFMKFCNVCNENSINDA